MDMSAGFATATKAAAPQSAITHDKFHVSKLLNVAVDQVRRREHAALQEGRRRHAKPTALPHEPVGACASKSVALAGALSRNQRHVREWQDFSVSGLSLKTAMDSRKRTQGAQRLKLGKHDALTRRGCVLPDAFPTRLPISVLFAFSCGNSQGRIQAKCNRAMRGAARLRARAFRSRAI
jgi:hypothetical protein